MWINRFQNRYKFRDQGIDLNLMRNMRAYYYACVSFIDYQVGRLLEALERTGQLDNTLILYNADHGEHLGDYNCFGKRSMHDTAARVPLLCRLPGRFQAGQQVEQVASHVDVAPTILHTAGTEFEDGRRDGADLAEVAAGKVDRPAVFSQLFSGEKAIYMAVNEEWKYVYSAPDRMEFMFDRVRDPEETRNRADMPFTWDAQPQMRETLMEFLRANGETEGIDGDSWKEYPEFEMPRNPDAGLLIQDHPWADHDIPGYTTET
jgi:arylsulfatase A-like enzyme